VQKRHESIEIVVSTDRSLSSMGSISREAILAVLKTRYNHVRISVVNTLQDLDAVVSRKPDLVFLGMKFIPVHSELGMHDPDKIWLSEYLEKYEIAYTGSGHESSKLEFNKKLAKQRVSESGINTARYMTVRKGDEITVQDIKLTYPLFVKPLDRGGGAGIDDRSLVYTFEQLKARVKSLAENINADALIEEYLPGREFSVGILKDVHSSLYAVMPIEIVAPKNQAGARFLSGSVKSADLEYTLAITDNVLKAKVNSLGLRAFNALGATDFGRIDVRLDAGGEPHFLEANLIPSLLDNYGNFPKTCLLNLGLSHKQVILQIVELGLGNIVNTDEPLEINPITSFVLDGLSSRPAFELS
jgi:D-alanine-D-alanine ligase